MCMKRLLLLLLILIINTAFIFGQVKQCGGTSCALFSIKKSPDRITFTNISNKLLWVVGFCETTDGEWETGYENFVPIFPKAQEDIQNLQYSCQCIRPTGGKLLTGKYTIFYYSDGDATALSIDQLKSLCKMESAIPRKAM